MLQVVQFYSIRSAFLLAQSLMSAVAVVNFDVIGL